MSKYLIINADDFGISPEANQAILELLQAGKLSSTSLMANGLAYDEAVALIKEHGLQNIGVHLTLTRDGFKTEKPLVYDSLTSCRSIVDEEGKLYTAASELKKTCSMKDLICECEAQIKRICESGICFTHIDNHMYSLFPDLGMKGYFAALYAYVHVCGREKIRGLRLAKRYLELKEVYPIWCGRRRVPFLLAAMKLLRLRGADYVYAFPYTARNLPELDEKKKCFEQFLRDLPEGITELHVHPIVDSPALRQYNPLWKNRVHEYQMLKEMDLDVLLKQYDVKMISYADVCRR